VQVRVQVYLVVDRNLVRGHDRKTSVSAARATVPSRAFAPLCTRGGGAGTAAGFGQGSGGTPAPTSGTWATTSGRGPPRLELLVNDLV